MMKTLCYPVALLCVVLNLWSCNTPEDVPTLQQHFDRAQALEAQKKLEEAIAAYGELARRLRWNGSPVAREWEVRALVHKGLVLVRQREDINLDWDQAQHKLEEALTVFNQVDRRFGQDQSPAVREWVVKALLQKGLILEKQIVEPLTTIPVITLRLEEEDRHRIKKQQQQRAELVTFYEEIDRRFGQDQTLAVRTGVAEALIKKGDLLDLLDRYDESFATYDEIVRRFSQEDSPTAREWTARTLIQKGKRWGYKVMYAFSTPIDGPDGDEEAVALYIEVIDRFSQDPAPAVRQWAAEALFNIGELLKGTHKLDAYDEVVRRFGEDEAPEVRQWAAEALRHKGIYRGDIATYDELDRRYGQDTAPEIRNTVVNGLSRKGKILWKQGKPDGMIAVYEEIDRRFSQNEKKNEKARGSVAAIFLDKGVCLGVLGRFEAAYAVFDEIDRRYAEDEDYFFALLLLPEALFAKGFLLEEEGKPEAALAVYEELKRRYGQDRIRAWLWLEQTDARIAFLKENGSIKGQGLFKQWAEEKKYINR
jgi:tetratricopeptide (TPR) repeat protein